MKNYTEACSGKYILIAGLVLLSLLAVMGSDAMAATYYVSPTGSNGNGGTSELPWQTLSYATSAMSGGDTLILKEGTYSGRDNIMKRTIPSGTADNYTIIKAENLNFNVLIDSRGFDQSDYPYPVLIDGGSYIQLEGLRFIGGVQGRVIRIQEGSHHVKVLKTGFIMMDGGSHAIEMWGKTDGGASAPVHDVLIEDVWLSGQMRYGIYAVYDCYDILVRRAVVRFDYATSTEPLAGIAFYGPSHDSVCQNCVVLDTNYYDNWGNRPGCSGPSSCFMYGAFYNPKAAKNIKHVGNIALNTKSGTISAGFAIEDGGYQTTGNDVINSIAWDVLKEGNDVSDAGNGIRPRGSGGTGGTASSNTIGMAGYGIRKGGQGFQSDHNLFVGNQVGNAVSASNHDYYDNNPMPYQYATVTNSGEGTSGLQWLPRSPMNASDGNPIGASIEKRYGVSGTYKGESGWDTLTDVDLWPWAYEDQIKADFRMSNPPSSGAFPTTNDTKRGFAADGNGLYGGPITLTSYIWEYLGYACPDDICSASTDLIAPSPPQNLRIESN